MSNGIHWYVRTLMWGTSKKLSYINGARTSRCDNFCPRRSRRTCSAVNVFGIHLLCGILASARLEATFFVEVWAAVHQELVAPRKVFPANFTKKDYLLESLIVYIFHTLRCLSELRWEIFFWFSPPHIEHRESDAHCQSRSYGSKVGKNDFYVYDWAVKGLLS